MVNGDSTIAERFAFDGDHSFLASVNRLRVLIASTTKWDDLLVTLNNSLTKFKDSESQKFQLASTNLEIGGYYLQQGQQGIRERSIIIEAWNHFITAADTFEKLTHYPEAAQAHYFIGLVWYEGIRSIPGLDNEVATQSCLAALSKAERLRDHIRQELSSSASRIEALQNKQELQSQPLQQSLTSAAFRLFHSKTMSVESWNWVQRRKARSLADLLGRGLMIPAYLQSKIENCQPAAQFLARESKLTDALRTAPVERRLDIQTELNDLRVNMQKMAPLEELMALREGPAEQIDTLDWLFSEGRQVDICVVDWICVGNDIFLLSIDQRRAPTFRKVPLELAYLEEWIRKHINIKSGLRLGEDVSPLRELDVLVRSLSESIVPGTMIILSPSGLLNSIPLHALFITDNTPLIERNPVVYCSNLSILHQCLVRSAHRSAWDHQFSSRVFSGVYDDEMEGLNVKSTLEKYSQLLDGTVVFGEEMTETAFQAGAEKASLLHFHGHASQQPNGSILDQGLELAVNEVVEPPRSLSKPIRALWQNLGFLSHRRFRREWSLDENAGPHVQDDVSSDEDSDFTYEEEKFPNLVTVRDVLTLKLGAPTIVLIACESAVQEVISADDPTGLVSAFLSAGATSVVGTLWAIRSVDGRRFADLFYEYIVKHSKVTGQGPREGLINLALAIQQAILELRRGPETCAPFHWASFVVNGAWKVAQF